jgi:hypothetical protein
MLQVMSAEEATLPYRGDLEFEDLESGERRLLDARAAQHAYQASHAGFLAENRLFAHRNAIDYALLRTDVAPEHALQHYLLRRGARHQSAHGARWGAR